MKRAADTEINNIDTGSPEFQNALKLISYTSQSVFLTGKAGTGKSTFLKYLTATTKKKYVVLAPTGIAAVNAGGQTLHSFFKLPFKPMLPDDPDFSTPRRLKQRLRYSKQMVKMLRNLDLIIIDEVSMVRADIIDFIDRILKTYTGNWRQPFGGKQLLLVGDVFQLEPVVTGDTRDVLSHHYKDGVFFFNANAFSDLSVVPIELNKVFRQTDTEFISMLDRIRVGAPSPADIAVLNSRVIQQNTLFDGDFVMTIATRRDIVDNINQAGLAKLPTPERTYTGVVNGDFPETSLPTDRQLILKEGAQVVFVKNDMERRWVNGTIGRVMELTDSQLVVELEDGTRHEVEPEMWENVKYGYDEEKKKVVETVIGTFSQFPIKLAWALTIHKSQGLTFDKVIIDVGEGAFSGGQTYVALSRCRSLAGIRLRSTINMRDIFVNRRVVDFSRLFNNDALINRALDFAKADDCYHRAAKCFDAGDFRGAASAFAEGVVSRNMLDREDVVRLLSMKMSKISRMQARIDELEAELAENRRRFSKLATEYVEMGEQVREEGWDIASALANYDKAISLDPDYSLAWTAKGLALASAGNEIDEAVSCLLKAAEIDSEDYRLLYEAGRLLVNGGDLAQGMDLLLRALDRNDKIPEIHDALAEGYERVDDENNAAAHRRTAKKLRVRSRRK